MRTNERNVVTTIFGSDDESKTFEVKRIWDSSKRIGIIIVLYPTIRVVLNLLMSNYRGLCIY